MDVLRSLLFVPAHREHMLESAAASKADALVLDLEDAVPERQKRQARDVAAAWIPRLTPRRRPVFARLNGIGTGMTRDDLMSIVSKRLTAVVLPKVEDPQDLRDLDVLLREAEMEHGVRPGDIGTIALIESARGVLRCEDIARASDRLVGLSVGAEDYTFDIGAPRGADALRHIRATVVQVATAYRLLAIDTPYPDHRDEAGLEEETRAAKAIGLRGKYAIHPAQVAAINRVFTPTVAEVEAAERIVAGYEDGLRRGLGAVNVDGRMVDAPVAQRACGVIAAARRRR